MPNEMLVKGALVQSATHYISTESKRKKFESFMSFYWKAVAQQCCVTDLAYTLPVIGRCDDGGGFKRLESGVSINL